VVIGEETGMFRTGQLQGVQALGFAREISFAEQKAEIIKCQAAREREPRFKIFDVETSNRFRLNAPKIGTTVP
jgi:hypothetical protein